VDSCLTFCRANGLLASQQLCKGNGTKGRDVGSPASDVIICLVMNIQRIHM
jgi:hypothetical protein